MKEMMLREIFWSGYCMGLISMGLLCFGMSSLLFCFGVRYANRFEAKRKLRNGEM